MFFEQQRTDYERTHPQRKTTQTQLQCCSVYVQLVLKSLSARVQWTVKSAVLHWRCQLMSHKSRRWAGLTGAQSLSCATKFRPEEINETRLQNKFVERNTHPASSRIRIVSEMQYNQKSITVNVNINNDIN